MDLFTSLAIAFLLCVLYTALRRLKRRLSGVKLLPGPPGYPIIGNLLDVPPKDGYLKFTKWKKTYGPIFELKVLDRTIVVINSHSVAVDLLDKRGAIYSDRPDMHMHDLAGWEWNAASMHHNERWRIRRRLVHQTFQEKKVPQFYALIRKTSLEYAQEMLARPHEFRHHIRRSAAANAIKAIYGIDVAVKDDPYVEIGEEAMHVLDQVVIPGSNIVEFFPFLRHLPEWIPGSPRSTARKLQKYPQAMMNVPYARFKEDLSKARVSPSMMSQCLEILDPDNGLDEQAVKEAGGVAYLGGADTSVASMTNFLRAMVICPEYQRKAQEELDRVIGRERLPDFADQAALPYVEAIIRETYRMYPVVPLGVPHALEEDDIYEGMLVKRRSTVIVNEWAILRDEDTYSNPDTFNPERFLKDGRLDPDVQDPRVTFFGYGRRICPGRHFADATVFLTIAMTLHCFSIKPRMQGGKEVIPSEELVTGLTSLPAPFRCTIEPRFERVASLVDDAYEMRPE
ncbi:cytochrome P450 [Exidia glandulosa HHB12029]|uniref:Cytochrome P450 n=1 Tax=Exidia glandulosa HHB12029 TaxID=1314781 RepID=A0A165NQB3_EXIGL|nr:cytochrome P450 [Exidia glandulosa HHB12029]